MNKVEKIWAAVAIVWALCQIVFIGLKLFGVIAWSWMVVLIPVLIFIVLVVLFILWCGWAVLNSLAP